MIATPKAMITNPRQAYVLSSSTTAVPVSCDQRYRVLGRTVADQTASHVVGFAPLRHGSRSQVGLRQWRAGIAEAIDDGITSVAAEVLQRDLHPGRRLPALVFGKLEDAAYP